MIPVSPEFLVEINRSHKIALEIEVLRAGQIQDVELNLIEGQVSITNELIHRSANVTITDPTGELTPANANDLLMPLGTEVILRRGVTYFDGSTEVVPLGVFGIDDVQIEDSGPNLTIRLDLFDRAKRVQRASFTKDYTIPTGTNYILALKNLLIDGYPAIQTNFPSLNNVTSNLIFLQGKSRWEAATKMANDIGYELYFDPYGVCVMQLSNRQLFPTLTFTDGVDGNLLDIKKRYNRDSIYSHVIVTGETTGNEIPVRGEAVDNDPQSPTYYKGPFGDVPYFYSSSFITTTEQAQATAAGMLAKVSGILEGVQFNSLVNPALDANDVIYVKRTRSKIDANYTLEKISLPLTQDRAMFGTCRQRSLDIQQITL